MKKIQLMTLCFLILGFNASSFASIKNSMDTHYISQLQNVGSDCPENCTSCWEQCSKSEDCGVGHKCISTPCGNRCIKE